MSIDEPDAISELAYGALTGDDLSQLYEAGRKIASPVLGVGKIADLVMKMKRCDLELYNPMGITENDVIGALTMLYQPCHAVNALCQEGLEHAISSLECGWYRKKSMAERLFLKPKIKRDPPCGQPDFLSTFTSGIETFWQGRTEGLEEFNDEETNGSSHVVFIVIFNKFMCYAIAQESRNLILLVDSLPNQSTRNRIVIPRLRNVGKRILDFFRKQTSLGVSGVWSTVVIVISLGPTTGASVNGLFLQSARTVFGGLVAMAVWYVVDKTIAAFIALSFVVTIFRMNVIGIKTNSRPLLFASKSQTGYSRGRLY
jgi:hypothetical protein